MAAIEGKNKVLLWRKLSQNTKEKAKLMFYETEHEVSLSADSESVKTKFANINKSSTTEEEVTFTTHIDESDSIYDYLEEAMQGQEILELWEINLTDPDGTFKKQQKYPAIYRQGTLSDLTESSTVDDYVEVSGTFKTNFVRQKGEATFTNEQLEAVAYKFEDTTIKEG